MLLISLKKDMYIMNYQEALILLLSMLKRILTVLNKC